MTQALEQENYEGWGIVELMGHRRLAGKLSTQKVAGASFLRIDIPARSDTAVESEFSATQFVNPTSIYAMHPTTEEVARAVAAKISPEPVTKWDVKALLPAEGIPANLPAIARQASLCYVGGFTVVHELKTEKQLVVKRIVSQDNKEYLD